jgi:ABC-2 type transport system ATP-binding protein
MGQRLGIAAALLGRPDVLLFDEPVNGLDPEGIVWIRNFMRSLAADGHTVFVSSHLMSEMALTADHLIVIGRGKLIADTSVAEFIASASTGVVKVRSPKAAELREWLTGPGVTVIGDAGDTLEVTGLTSDQIGQIASDHLITLFELAPRQASLEEAFMELTSDAVEYRAPARTPQRSAA